MSDTKSQQLEREAIALEERADLLRHVADGGQVEYAYSELINSYAGPPARWWPLEVNTDLSAESIASQLDGYVAEEPVIYRKVAAKIVRYAIADDMGLVSVTAAKEELALKWLKERKYDGARIVKLVEAEY